MAHVVWPRWAVGIGQFSFCFRQLRRPIGDLARTGPGIAFLTTERQKLPFQGRSFGTEWWTTDVDTGKKKHVLPRHVGFNNVPLIKSENWTRFLRFVARNRTKAPVFLLVCPRMSSLFYFEWYLLLAFV